MCAGVTVFNALRNSGARGGDVVAVHGIGGLGHLGVQSQDTLEFSALNGVRPMIEKYPLSRVVEAYEQMLSDKARFRVVLTLGV